MLAGVFEMITSDLVFAETLKHLQRMVWNNTLRIEKVEQFADYVLYSDEILLVEVNRFSRMRGYEISRNHYGQKLDYIDGTSLALIEELGIIYAFSFDAHFDYSYKKGHNFVYIKRLPD